ncbi:pilus assembly protein CpaB [Amaricoccus macauensis]|uniref:Pilus assembly protein CpaB n=1 Tax=Amaricoccus macauensis TaxID=57001 RepID=A0A840SNG8_9RHOB|nr:Flp pilus assembly protein CpaB [Amaricoccus macauensis]MBB5223547.1 pilus assembly protein CpaB [Amaricoccus macauensis]
MRMVLVILAALIVAGGTGFYVMQSLRPAPPEPVRAEAPAPRLQVYVAARAIPVGTILTPGQLGRMAIDDRALGPEMIVADDAGSTLLAGSVARQPLAAGLPIARSAIVQPGERGFLAAVLPRGKRAITIPVDEIGSLSGLALPGDRVDVLLTYALTSTNGDAEPVRASETVLRGLRVLAFDQRLGPRPEDLTTAFEATPVARTATLEVSPREAEVVTLMQTLGTLSLTLNSVRDDADDASGDKLELTGGPLHPSDAPMRPNRLTLSSDVTSTSRVQVVRGTTAHATMPSPSAAPAPAE